MITPIMRWAGLDGLGALSVLVYRMFVLEFILGIDLDCKGQMLG